MTKPDFTLSTKKIYLQQHIKANSITLRAKSKNNFKLQVILSDGINTLDNELSNSINPLTFSDIQNYNLLDFLIKEGDEIDIYISLA